MLEILQEKVELFVRLDAYTCIKLKLDAIRLQQVINGVQCKKVVLFSFLRTDVPGSQHRADQHRSWWSSLHRNGRTSRGWCSASCHLLCRSTTDICKISLPLRRYDRGLCSLQAISPGGSSQAQLDMVELRLESGTEVSIGLSLRRVEDLNEKGL